MKHGSVTRSVQFRSPVQGLAASLLLLLVLIVTDGLHGLSAPRRPWDLRGGFADTVAAAAEEQQHREQHSAAAALAAAATERPNQEQQAGQQLGLVGLPPEQLGAFAGQQEAPPPPLPPPHQHDVQRQQDDEQQQEEPQHVAQHTEQQGQQQQEAQQDEEQQGAQQQQQQEAQQDEEQQGAQQQQQQATPTAVEPLPRGQDDATLAFCIAVKDEHCDIREWVLHHAQLGAGKFYVFDTGSDPSMEPVLDDLIASGLVHYIFLTNTTSEIQLEQPPPGRSFNWQRPIYSLCLQRYGQRHKWMGFIDADEFVMLQDGVASLPDLLRGYERHGGLGLHWQLFTFDRHVERPAGGLLASYTACCGREAHAAHRHIKSFVQPRYTMGPQTVHSFNYHKGRHAVNTAGTRLDGPMLKPGQQVSYQGAVVHHYISRSLADFAVKQERRDGTGNVKQLSDFLNWHRKCTERCSAAVPLGQQLAAQFDLNRNVPPRCLLTER